MDSPTLAPTEKDLFDLATVMAQDEVQFYVTHPKTKKPTTWCWTFYGPGHPNTVAVANRVIREALETQAAKEQARVNGRKWKEEAEEIETLRQRNIASIVARTKEFSPVKIGPETITFSPETASKLLLDRNMGWLLDQVTEWLASIENFIQPSPKS